MIFDKSTLESSLSVDEAVLLDNFYLSNITPLFYVECLADLERKMVRMKSTPEQLVGSLAERTPDSQSSANVDDCGFSKDNTWESLISTRCFCAISFCWQTRSTRGLKGHDLSAERRTGCPATLDLERQIAKGWRRMISQIDLNAMPEQMRRIFGPWRKPTSLQDARTMTNTIIDNIEPELLLRFGLIILGVPEATDYVINDWIANRRKPLREYRPYFIHMLSINIFFGLILPTQLLRNVKQSHHIDLAYLYYLPFCAVFSSRDNFHVQVAPLFMHAAQQFIHGDDLKADLKRLNDLYLGLPQEIRDQGLYEFAPAPPDDSTYLTTRLWDAYLPKWRADSKKVDISPDLQKALMELIHKYQEKSVPVSGSTDVRVDDLDFVQVSKKIKPAKGSYLRFSKEVILKNYEDERRKRYEPSPPGTQFSSLMNSLADLFRDHNVSDVEVIFISLKLDDMGEKVVEDNQHIAQIRAVGINGMSDETQDALREQYEMFPLISLMVLWTRRSTQKLGILKFYPITPDNPYPAPDYEDWEKRAIGAYMGRHNL